MKNSDTSPEVRRVQIDLYRRMSPARKFELIRQAYQFCQTLAVPGIRMRYRNATEEEVRGIWAREHLGKDLHNKVYGDKVSQQAREEANGLKADTSGKQ